MSVQSSGWEVVTATSEAEHAMLGAELLARAIDEAIRARGHAYVALSGGTTPGPVYRKLAEYALPLGSIDWFWVDERAVPANHLRSNYRTCTDDLQLARVDADRVHRMEADSDDLPAAAQRYERLLRQTFGVASAVAFDAVVLGVGDDGHTASLFPRTGAVDIDDRLVAAIEARPARGLDARISLTAPVLCEAKFVLVLAKGIQKRAAIAAAFMDGSQDDVPARLLRRARGKIAWVFDQHVQDAS